MLVKFITIFSKNKLGFSDKVTCYACGVGLSDWSPEADPASQHAKASPLCMFLLQSKGKEFIDNSQNIQVKLQLFIAKPIFRPFYVGLRGSYEQMHQKQ